MISRLGHHHGPILFCTCRLWGADLHFFMSSRHADMIISHSFRAIFCRRPSGHPFLWGRPAPWGPPAATAPPSKEVCSFVSSHTLLKSGHKLTETFCSPAPRVLYLYKVASYTTSCTVESFLSQFALGAMTFISRA